jgi:hypothetical protein
MAALAELGGFEIMQTHQKPIPDSKNTNFYYELRKVDDFEGVSNERWLELLAVFTPVGREPLVSRLNSE